MKEYFLHSVEIRNLFFSMLLEATARTASAPAAVASLSVIIPEKVIQHNHKAQGWFGGTGTVPSDNRQFAICQNIRVQQGIFLIALGLARAGE